MRIALLHPTYWPEVRHGSERVIHDLATELASRGHEVTILTAHDRAASVTEESGVTVCRRRRPPHMRPLRWYEDHVAAMPGAALAIRRGRFDLVHAFDLADAWTATQLRQRLGGPPLVASLRPIPSRPWLVERRYRMQMLGAVIAAAGALTVASEAAAEALRDYLMADAEIVPGGIRCADFRVDRPADPGAGILCSAGLWEPRQRRDLLLEAVALLRRDRPEAELRIVRPVDSLVFSWQAPSRPDGVTWVEASDTGALAARYAAATASVLAAVDDGHGVGAIESLAAGTPVVAARSGALPGIVAEADPALLFEPDDAADLARALAEALDADRGPEAVERRRSVAAAYDVALAADAFETLYDRVGA